jgi:hypothetical protein
MKNIVINIFLSFLLFNCKSTSAPPMNTSAKANGFEPQYTAGPPTIVYKTKEDYSNLVPVLLSGDKTKIVSFPHQSDLKAGDNYLTPTSLKGGYLLDNRGINANVAFLKLTYEEYSRLTTPPSLDELFKLISIKDPLLELCNCGNRNAFTNVADQLNQMIEAKVLREKCKVAK